MNPLTKAYYMLRYLGPRFAWLRAGVFLRDKLGVTRRRFRPRPWNGIDLASIASPPTPTDARDYARFKLEDPPAFLFPLGRPPAIPKTIRAAANRREPDLAERIKLLAEDRCVYFFRTPSPESIEWHKNPFDGKQSHPTRIWCDIPDFCPKQGDVRTLWEPARAAWAIDLARARARGLDPSTGEMFWHWTDSWMAANPPFLGVQWKCGQESSVRMIAIALGFWSVAGDAATTPERWVQFARLAWATGYRIANYIEYALSQSNNHALSEACGLLLISRLFPEFRESPRWEAIGREVLSEQLWRQTCEDGSYLQHSMNYHRVMLHTAILGLRLAELSGRPFDRDLYGRVGRCGEFLHQMMDTTTGRAPNYGHNDGANILPLSECDFTDFRPVIQAAHFLATRRRLLPRGPWDEDLLWLFGPEAMEAKPEDEREPASTAFDAGGYYTLRRGDSWAMIRCHTYHDRPGQCDPLHVDLWWRGQNVLQDCGTYRYYCPGREDIERYFKSIAAHNTIEVDGRDPVEPVSRFLWLPWPKARKRRFEPNDKTASWFEGEHRGYDRGPSPLLHRRMVVGLDGDIWMIVDDLLGVAERRATLRWHLIDVPYEADPARSSLTLAMPTGKMTIFVTGHPALPGRFEVVRGRDEPNRVQGFASTYYGQRSPAPTLEVDVSSVHTPRLITVVSPGDAATARMVEETAGRQHWEIAGHGGAYIIELARPERGLRIPDSGLQIAR